MILSVERKYAESFKSYKKRMKKERKRLKEHLKGWWYWYSKGPLGSWGTLKKDKDGYPLDKKRKPIRGLI